MAAHSRTALTLAGAVLLSTAGCLNLGGRTTYVQEGAETTARLTSLEYRVSQLERSLSIPSATAPANQGITVTPNTAQP